MTALQVLQVYVRATNNGERAYPPHSRLSFVSHDAERISIASVKGVNRAILHRRAKLARFRALTPRVAVGPLGA